MPSRRSARTPRLRSIGASVIAAAAVLAGCGGGGSSAPLAAPAPLVVSGDSNFSVTQTIVISATPGGGTTTVALPSASTVSGAISFPPPLAPITAMLAETMQNSVPSADGVPALAAGRLPKSALGVRAASTSTTLIYLRLIVSTVVQLPGSPAFSFSVSASNLVPGATYYIAAFDDEAHPRDWDIGWEGPATVNGTTLTFAANTAAFTFAADAKYWFALVAVGTPLATPVPTASPGATATPAPTGSPTAAPTNAPSGSPTSAPTPAPTSAPTAAPTNAPTAAPTNAPTAAPTRTPTPTSTPTPTPTPTATPTPTPTPTSTPTAIPTVRPTATPTPTASPAPGPLNVDPYPTLNINDVGAANAKMVSVSESPYASALSFAESDTCSPPSGTIATIVTANAHGPSASYTVTGVVQGTCTATFTDAFAQSRTINVVVTTTRVIIQGKHR